MIKVSLKSMLLLFVVCLTFSQVVQAENNNQEGKTIYHIKYDYDALYNFLNVNPKKYNQYWKDGLSIAEMANKQGISRHDLESYFVSLHYKEMQKWRSKGALSEKDYFELVYVLKADIGGIIDRNPNK